VVVAVVAAIVVVAADVAVVVGNGVVVAAVGVMMAMDGVVAIVASEVTGAARQPASRQAAARGSVQIAGRCLIIRNILIKL
jgi:hypothetical protein